MNDNAERWGRFHFVLVAVVIAMGLAALLLCAGCTIASLRVGKVLTLSVDASLTWPVKADLLPAEPADNQAPDVAPSTPPDIPPGASLPPGWDRGL